MRQIKIGNKWTFDDYGLWLAPDPSIEEATPKTHYVDIPFGNGSIDLTEALTGEVVYENRLIKFGLVLPADVSQWDGIRKQLTNEIHGRKLEIVMPQYPYYIFKGRLSVGRLKEDNSVATIPVTAEAEPFMLKEDLTYLKKTIPAGGTLTLQLENERMTTLPVFSSTAEVQLVFKSKTYTHSAGTFQNAGILLTEGTNTLKINAAAGTVIEIEYQEGSL